MNDVTLFEEYCYDIAGYFPGEDDADFYAAFRAWKSGRKTSKAPAKARRNGDDLPVAEVRAKLERLLISQKIEIERNPTLSLSVAKDFIARCDSALAKRTKKDDLLDLIEENSDVSRFIKKQNGL